MKSHIIFFINLLFISLLATGQQSTVVLNSTIGGNQTVVARDAIFLVPGFNYTATSGQSFTASINSQLQPQVYSTGEQVVNPVTRTLNTSLPVGTLPGDFNVNSQGAATYQIPVFVSPGTAGMQPKVSIVYNSMVDDGLLGKGWDIAGLSEIRRVSQNFYNDTNVTGVTLQSTDKFALDSNRLILTSQHQYGADGSEYATEIETFVKVIAHGTAGTGPGWFEVKTKDGLTLDYGNTSSSKVEAYGSSTVYMWRINRIKDQNGNYMDFSYFENNGESYIEKIEYTGNLVTQLNPYNTLKFNYSERQDSNTYYSAGSKVPHRALLTSIRMETEGGALVREYQFRYVLDIYTHLNEIVEYGIDHKYLNSTAVGWGSTASSTFSDQNAFNNSKKDKFYLGDFNGDGRIDFVVTEDKTSFTTSDKWKLYFATTPGTGFSYINEGSLNGYFKGFIVADVDGNGKDDVFWRARETVTYPCNPHLCDYEMNSIATISLGETDNVILPPPPDTCWDECSYQREAFWYYYYDGTSGLVRGSTTNDMVFNNAAADISLIPVELDGNGKIDYMVFNSNKNVYAIRGITYSDLWEYNEPDDIRFFDFNGNGKMDILVIKNSSSAIYEFNTLTGHFDTIYTSSTFPTSTDRLFFGDYNGDKKTDILSWKSNAWSLKLSTGINFITSTAPGLRTNDPDGSDEDDNYYIADFNGDKKDDILEVYKESTSSRLKLFYSKGCGSFDSEINTYSKSTVDQDFFNPGDFNGDGQKDMFYYDYNLTTNYVNICFFHKDELKHNVKNIANGLNFKTQINYRRLNYYADSTYASTEFYKRNSEASFPVYDFKGPMYVVSGTQSSSGVGSDNINSAFSYEGAWIHRQGKTFLGFAIIRYDDNSIGLKKHEIFEYNPTFYNVSLKSTVIGYLGFPVLSSTVYTNSVIDLTDKRIFSNVSQSVVFDTLNGKRITATYAYDIYGNQTSITTAFKRIAPMEIEDATKTITNTFGFFGNDTIPNKLTRSVSSTTYTNRAPFSRTVDLDYDNKGNLLTEKSDPGKTKEVTKTYSSYNSYGLPGQVTVSASGLTSKTTNFEYDTKSRFVTKNTNPLGHYSEIAYNNGTGAIISQTGIDGKTTLFGYDNLGRLIKTTTPQGHIIESVFSWVTDPEYYSIYTVTTTTPGRPDVKKYFDIQGREVKSEVAGQFGTIYAEKVYKPGGTLHKESYPHYSNEMTKWKTYGYDNYSRIDTITENGLTTFIQYGYNSVTTIKPAGQRKTIKKNSMGDIVQITDLGGSATIDYTYHSSGQPSTISTNGITVTNAYDDYGRQDSIINPNCGLTTFDYNAYGQLISQTDANNKTYQTTYDLLGRSVTKTGPNNATTSYNYNSGGNGIEQIHSITGPNGITQTFGYDDYGRTTQVEESIPNDQSFTTSFGYDSYGNNTIITYPSGYSITKTYSDGYLSGISQTNGPSIITVNNSNGLGQTTEYSMGSSSLKTYFSYSDEIGAGLLEGIKTGNWQQNFNISSAGLNIVSRTYYDSSNPLPVTEYFKYDSLNRLTVDSIYNVPGIHMNYEANGNITFKTDAGNYQYQSSKVNAVTGITNNPGTISSIAQSLTYTDFGMAESVTEGDYNIQFTYGPDNQRIKSVLRQNNNIIKIKYYSLNYEKEITASGIREINYITSVSGLVAVDIKKNNTDTLYYVETDHLGSILGLIKPDGTYKERYSFDPWGRRRNPTNWSYNNITAPTILDRGFTGHEHLDVFGLINMNGRMYDPVLGRFLGVDPVIQSPDYSQSYNGYSYCMNNPLKYTDPTGYTWWSHLTGWAKEHNISGIIVGMATPGGQTALLGGGIEAINNGGINWHLSQDTRNAAWTKADPTMRGTKFNNSARLTEGLFAADTRKSGWGWQIASRFTWQSPQELIGLGYSQFSNLAYDGSEVEYKYGTTVLAVRNKPNFTIAVTFGNYITGQDLFGSNSDLVEHEYGHYLQSQVSGPLYLLKYGIPSAINNDGWTESDAWNRGIAYFNGMYNRKDYKSTNPRWWEFGIMAAPFLRPGIPLWTEASIPIINLIY